MEHKKYLIRGIRLQILLERYAYSEIGGTFILIWRYAFSTQNGTFFLYYCDVTIIPLPDFEKIHEQMIQMGSRRLIKQII